VLNQAIDACIETYRWQIEHIREGVRQADAGEFASAEDVAAAFAKLRK
jgi:predicted transcriptional regulator